MSDILTLQRHFKNHLYKKSNEKLLDSLPYSKLEALARLNIYRNNVFGNFNSVLSSIFVAVKKLVGAKYFAQLCEEYNQKHHSKSGNLDNYGNLFPQFLSKIKNKHKLAFLSDVARLELLYHQSYFSADAKIFDIEKFKKISPENLADLKFDLHPSCFILASKFPIFSIWKDNIEKKGRKKISLNSPEFSLIYRASNIVQIQKLSEAEFLFLKNISDKKLFETYKKIIRTTKTECDIGMILNKFISAGIITNFKSGEPND